MPAGLPRVFDSWAVIAFLEAEPAAPLVRSFIRAARVAQAPIWISVVNLGELWYKLARKYSEPEADFGVEQIQRLGFEIQDADWTLTRRAAHFKSKHRLSYAGCFAAALAKERNAELVTGDPEFKRLENEIRICWL